MLLRFLTLALVLTLAPSAVNAQNALPGLFGVSRRDGITIGRTPITGGVSGGALYQTPGGVISSDSGLTYAGNGGALTTGALAPTGSITAKVRSSGSSTVTISATTDYFLCLDPTSNAIAANLPASPATGLTYLIKDCTGKAATNNITVTPNSGNIDGAPTFVMSTNYQSIGATYTGSQWSVN